MHLAHFMWSNIMLIRVVLIIALVAMVVMASGNARWIMIGGAVPLGLAWFGVFWLFEKIWTGRVKFPGITQKVFATAKENELDPELQVIGVDYGGEQKAFPVNMITFHHQIVDQVADLPVWVTYCGLCRSGRVYDINVDGQTLDFTLVGAISFNATFEDNQTGTWWRQETGEAAKGKLAGRVLEDVPAEQMTLATGSRNTPIAWSCSTIPSSPASTTSSTSCSASRPPSPPGICRIPLRWSLVWKAMVPRAAMTGSSLSLAAWSTTPLAARRSWSPRTRTALLPPPIQGKWTERCWTSRPSMRV